MKRFHNVLDSDSDEEIGWSRTKDLPRNRASWELEVFRQAAIEEVGKLPPSDKKIREFVLRGPGDKNFTIQVKERENTETVEECRLMIEYWPEKLLKKFVQYVPVEDRVKLRCTCKTLRNLVDSEVCMTNEPEIYIKRLGENDLGLFIAVNRGEERFVIHNKKFTFQQPHIFKTYKDIRRGSVDWTRYHRNRMGRIRTAIKAMMNIARIVRINVEQVNLSDSFIRDLHRVIASGACIYAVNLKCQYFEDDRPDLRLLAKIPCKSLALSIRLKEREPLPQIERFLKVAVNSFRQIIVDVRQDSWKFRSTVHFRASYEEIGINNAAFMEYLTGEACNFIRLKVICRFLSKEGIYNGILQLRTRDPRLPTRGFSVIVLREETDDFIIGLQNLPKFGQRVNNPNSKSNGYIIYQTTKEYLEIRHVRQDVGKQELSEVRYWCNGCDDEEEYINERCDDDNEWDPFEQPKFLNRIS